MATIGNLFVNVGARTQNLERGLKSASGQVANFRNDVMASMQNIPASGFLVNAMREADGYYKKIIGNAEGARAATARLGDLHKSMADSVTDGQRRIAEATKKSDDAQQKLSSAFKYTKLKASSETVGKDLASLMPKLEKASADYKSALLKTGRAQTDKAVADAIKTETLALQKFNAILAERNRLEGKRVAMGKGLAAGEASLSRAGVALDRSGRPNIKTLQSDASAAKTNVQVVTDSALKRQDAIKTKILDTTISLKSFGAMSVTSAAGLATLGTGAVAVVGAMLSLTASAAAAADALVDQATALGMSVTALQRQRDAMHHLGVGAGVAETQMQRLQISLSGGDDKTTGASAAFKKLGLDMASLRKMSPDQSLNATLAAIRKLGDQSQRMKMLRELFGRGGVGLAAAVNATNEELDLANAKARALTLPEKMYKDLSRTHDSLVLMGRGFENIKTMLASSFAPVLDVISESLFEMFTTDTKSMTQGLTAVSLVVSAIYDLLALVVNHMRALWNIVQAIAGILMAGVAATLGAVLSSIEWIVWGFEKLTGKTHEWSEALGQAATTTNKTAIALAKGAGQDLVEAASAIKAAWTPDGFLAAMDEMDEMDRAWEELSGGIESNPVEMVMQSDAAIAAIADIEKQMTALRESVRTAGMSSVEKEIDKMRQAGAAAGSSDADMASRETEIRALTQQQAIGSAIADQAAEAKKLQAEYSALVMSSEQLVQLSIADLGLQGEKAEAFRRQAAANAELAKELQNTKAIQETMLGLESAAATAGMGEREKLEWQLQLNNAKDEEIAKALTLFDLATKMSKQQDIKTQTEDLEKQLFEATASRREIVTKMAQEAGLVGEALESAVNKIFGLEESIKQVSDSKKSQDDAARTIENMGDQLVRFRMGDKAFDRAKFSEGATPEQLVQYDMLSKQLEMIDPAEGNQVQMESLETAMGSFTTGSKLQERLLSSSDEQVAVLQQVATHTGALAMMKADAATSGAIAMTTTSTDPLMVEANRWLSEIASNTKGQLT